MPESLVCSATTFIKQLFASKVQQHSPILNPVGDLMLYLLCKGRALPALFLISDREEGLQQLWHLRHEGLDRIQVGSSQATNSCWKKKVLKYENSYSLEKGKKKNRPKADPKPSIKNVKNCSF